MIRSRTLRRRLAFRLRWSRLLNRPFGYRGDGRLLPLSRPLLGPFRPLAAGHPLVADSAATTALHLESGLLRTAADRIRPAAFPTLRLPLPLQPLCRLLHRAHPQPVASPLPPT